MMQFVHMHGTGNAFLVFDAFRDPVPGDTDLSVLARRLCDRTHGVGGDGLLVVEPADGAAAQMRVYNADGSVPEMCGNGLRCAGKLLEDRRYAERDFVVMTDAGPRRVEVLSSEGNTATVRISLGRPVFAAAQIPTTLQGTPPVEALLDSDATSGEGPWRVTCVSMGNPHAVMFVEDPGIVAVDRIGPLVEGHAAFPNRTNVGFVAVASPTDLRLRVWERGCGETLACGTGAGAAAVAGVLTGRSSRSVTVHLRGGDLRIGWPNDAAEVSLTGEAVTIGTVKVQDR